jgi:hypothetical protein
MTDTTQAPAIVPDELVKAAEALKADLIQRASFTIDPSVVDASDGVWCRFVDALSLPRRTEADIRADERERIAKIAERRFVGGDIIAQVIRSQGGEDE